MLKKKRSHWRRAALPLALAIALALAASSDELHHALSGVLHWVELAIDRHPIAGVVAFLGFAALSAMISFVSIAILVPAAVLAWGESASLLLLWAGWILGGVGTYIIGRFLGRPIVRWFASDRNIEHFADRVRRDAPFSLVLLLQLALPSEIPGYVLGLAHYRFASYLLALALGELPYTFATVHLGMSFVADRVPMILLTGLSIALLVFCALHLLQKAMRPLDG